MEVFMEVFIQPFQHGDMIGYVVGSLAWAIALFICGLIAYGIYYLVDTVGQPLKPAEARVTEKKFVPKHTVTNYTPINKTMMPITTTIPDMWEVEIDAPGLGSASLGVSEDFYKDVKIGTWIKIRYKTGRLSGGFYAEEIIS